MANAYAGSEKHYDRQLAAAYIVYMMAGDLFDQCHFASRYMENRLFLHYCEMPEKKQEDLESVVLSILRMAGPSFLSSLAELRSEVSFHYCENDLILRFVTGFEEIEAVIDRSGHVELRFIRDESA